MTTKDSSSMLESNKSEWKKENEVEDPKSEMFCRVYLSYLSLARKKIQS